MVSHWDGKGVEAAAQSSFCESSRAGALKVIYGLSRRITLVFCSNRLVMVNRWESFNLLFCKIKTENPEGVMIRLPGFQV